MPAALPPECLISETEVKYTGSQWTTMKGQPCLPWIYVTGVINSLRNDQLFQNGSVVTALNYCRNPTRDPQGPFCFVQDTTTNLVQQEYCHPRKCRASGNRMSNVQKVLPQGLDVFYLVLTHSNLMTQNYEPVS